MGKISKQKIALRAVRKSPTEVFSKGVFEDISRLIESTRNQIAHVVNTGLVLLYWKIGERIHREILKGKRAEYGEVIFQTLSGKLGLTYGRGYSKSNLFNMVRMAEVFPDIKVVAELSKHLGWSHFLEIIYLSKDMQRDFYAEMCRIERWSVRELRKKIDGMLFERTALSKKPAKLVKRELKKLREENQMTPDLVFREPYFLDFLGMKAAYSEKDLESAILRELEDFMLELGAGFTFIARQKRITIDRRDYYIDLLFFHRKLRCMVAIELKLGRFQSADKGQMELYLRWLEKYEKQPGENSPMGLILCADKSDEHVELLQLEKSGIRVAKYLTELPSRNLLRKTLHQAIIRSRKKLKNQ
ncbi:MAG: PDDEXK nuclease domain-containing protein [Rhabdochlamydiaceae bacterium]